MLRRSSRDCTTPVSAQGAPTLQYTRPQKRGMPKQVPSPQRTRNQRARGKTSRANAATKVHSLQHRGARPPLAASSAGGATFLPLPREKLMASTSRAAETPTENNALRQRQVAAPPAFPMRAEFGRKHLFLPAWFRIYGRRSGRHRGTSCGRSPPGSGRKQGAGWQREGARGDDAHPRPYMWRVTWSIDR